MQPADLHSIPAVTDMSRWWCQKCHPAIIAPVCYYSLTLQTGKFNRVRDRLLITSRETHQQKNSSARRSTNMFVILPLNTVEELQTFSSNIFHSSSSADVFHDSYLTDGLVRDCLACKLRMQTTLINWFNCSLFRSEKPASIRQHEQAASADAGSLTNLLDAINREFPVPGRHLVWNNLLLNTVDDMTVNDWHLVTVWVSVELGLHVEMYWRHVREIYVTACYSIILVPGYLPESIHNPYPLVYTCTYSLSYHNPYPWGPNSGDTGHFVFLIIYLFILILHKLVDRVQYNV